VILSKENLVEFNNEKKYWTINDQNKFHIVTLYPERCSCLLKPNCLHILAVKTKLGQPLNIYNHKPNTLSNIISTNTGGNKFKSKSGCKMKYQTRNTTRNTNFVTIENGTLVYPYIIELIDSEKSIDKIIEEENQFEENDIVTDISKLRHKDWLVPSKSWDFLKVLSIPYLYYLLKYI
jgi:hypothetical protein